MRRFNRFLRLVLVSVGVGSVVVLTWVGQEYYRLPNAQRVFHEWHLRLKPDGLLGHFYGFVGVLLIAINLAYLARRHLPLLRTAGTLKSWMQIHVFAGLIGPAFVLFHSAFLALNPIAVLAMISLLALVLTGLIGRYIYAQVPHTLTGAEEGFQELRNDIQEALDELVERAGESYAILLERINALMPEVAPAYQGPLRTFVSLPALSWHNWQLRRQVNHIYREFVQQCGLNHAECRPLLRAMRRIVQLQTRMRFLQSFRSLLAWWRGLHRYFALVMVITALIHIAVSIYMGAGWIFS